MTQIVAATTVDETAERLARYPQPRLAAFLAALGAQAPRDRTQAAREAARLLHTSDRLAVRVAALAPEVRDVFLLCALRSEPIDAQELVQRAWAFRGISKDRTLAARDQLVLSGLLSGEFGVCAPPDAHVGCADLVTAWLARAEPGSAEPLPLRFLLALAGSLVSEERPALTQQGRPHARWLRKAQERMLHPACPPYWTDVLLDVGHFVRLWRAAPEGGGTRLVPDAEHARRALALPAEEFRAAFVGRWTADSACPVAYGWALTERAFRDLRGEVASFSDALEAAHALDRLSNLVADGFAPWGGHEVASVAESLAYAERAGLVDLERGPGLPRIRRAEGSPCDGRWTVLPSYEVLVPADAPPDAVFRLGCIARLDRVDRVARFVLDRTSVRRRSRVPGLAASALEILAERSAFALPDTVAAAVAAWDVPAAPPLRGYFGGVFVAATPAQADVLRADAKKPREIAPGVFLVPELEIPGVAERASKAGLPVAAVERLGRWDRPSSDRPQEPPDLVTAAAQFRKRLDQVMTATPPRPPARPAPTPSAGRDPARLAAPTAETPDSVVVRRRVAEHLAVGEHGLRNGWPTVHAAACGVPRTLAAARTLPAELLPWVAEGHSVSSIRTRVTIQAKRWKDMLDELVEEVASPLATWAREGASMDEVRSRLFAPQRDEDGDEIAIDMSWDDEPPPSARTSRSTATSTRTAAPVRPARPAPAPTSSEPAGAVWQVAQPGELRQRLDQAARTGTTLGILYANSAGQKRERRIRPTAVRTAGGADWVDGVEGGANASFRLDRIAAVRE